MSSQAFAGTYLEDLDRNTRAPVTWCEARAQQRDWTVNPGQPIAPGINCFFGIENEGEALHGEPFVSLSPSMFVRAMEGSDP